MLTKKEAKEMINDSCSVRGEQILMFKKEVIRLGGKGDIKKFEQEIEKLGCSFRFNKISALDWYPMGIRTICFIVLKDIYKLTDDDIVGSGVRFIGDSIVIKLFFRYFSSRDTAFKHIPEYWKKISTCGRAEAVKLVQSPDGKEGYFIARLHDFKIHPLHCLFCLGAFLQLAKLLGGKNAKIKETKCMFKGDDYHEYVISWGK